MAPSPRCTALANAMASKGLSYAQLAGQTGLSEQHLVDVCTGAAHPTDAEFNLLAQALGISGASVEHAR